MRPPTDRGGIAAPLLAIVVLAAFTAILLAPAARASSVKPLQPPHTTCYAKDHDVYGNFVDATASIEGPTPETSAGGASSRAVAGEGCLNPLEADFSYCLCSQYDPGVSGVIPLNTGDSAYVFHAFGTGDTGAFIGASGSICEAHASVSATLGGYCGLCRG